MGLLSKIVGKVTGSDDAAKASTEAAEMAAAAEREKLEYLKETNALPQQFREGGLTRLAGLYGMEGGEGSQQELIDMARSSPLYSALTGTREAGEDSILRNQAATGGFRSGDMQSNLFDFNQRLDERALLESYNQQLGGLQGLAGLQTNENNIANSMSNVGQIQAQGIQAAGQAKQAGMSGFLNTAASLGGIAMGNAGWSDRRLKEDVTLILNGNSGVNIYHWRWNDEARKLGLSGESIGVMADEIEQVHPEMVGEALGYKTVNYDELEKVA